MTDNCPVKQMEPYSPWQNAAEGAICEMKKASGRKMIGTSSPKVLWDDCLDENRNLIMHGSMTCMNWMEKC